MRLGSPMRVESLGGGRLYCPPPPSAIASPTAPRPIKATAGLGGVNKLVGKQSEGQCYSKYYVPLCGSARCTAAEEQQRFIVVDVFRVCSKALLYACLPLTVFMIRVLEYPRPRGVQLHVLAPPPPGERTLVWWYTLLGHPRPPGGPCDILSVLLFRGLPGDLKSGRIVGV